MPKAYFLDMGLRNRILQKQEFHPEIPNIGNETENLAYLFLREKFDEKNIFFWRSIGGAEIDFCIEKSFEELILIECKWKEKKEKVRAFSSFEKIYRDKKKITKIITTKDILEYEDGVYHIPLVLLPFIDL